MSDYIIIDGGTTNTRVCFVSGGEVVSRIKKGVGAANGKDALVSAIRAALEELKEKSEGASENAKAIIASGMITSGNGLYELNHISAPCGIKELHGGMKEVLFEEISNLPFWFIPGVKKSGETEEESDMMRGEESELFGLCDKTEPSCAYVLPGSHSKCILTDEKGRICDFLTFLTGEMISALSKDTILKNSISFCEADYTYLERGFLHCDKYGLCETLFKVRVLDTLGKKSKSECFGYFLGAVFCGEIKRILSIGAKKVVVGGKAELREPEGYLLNKFAKNTVIEIKNDEACENAAEIGALHIFEAK